jgi:hypothetical protein
MKAICHDLLCVAVALCFGMFALHVTAADNPFKADELKLFLADSGPFFEWIQTNHEERVLERLMEQPRLIAEFPSVVHYLKDHKWKPERFAYILNHIVVAYKRMGMGKAPGQLQERLEQTKIAVRADATQNESEKARTLAIIAEAQRDALKTDKAFAEIPPEEVRLMWLHRADIHHALDGHLPLSKRILPNPVKKP